MNNYWDTIDLCVQVFLLLCCSFVQFIFYSLETMVFIVVFCLPLIHFLLHNLLCFCVTLILKIIIIINFFVVVICFTDFKQTFSYVAYSCSESVAIFLVWITTSNHIIVYQSRYVLYGLFCSINTITLNDLLVRFWYCFRCNFNFLCKHKKLHSVDAYNTIMITMHTSADYIHHDFRSWYLMTILCNVSLLFCY